MSSSNSKTSSKLPAYGKEYICFHIGGKYVHAAQCAKSQALTKFIGSILDIESFEQKCVIMKGLLQLDWIKQRMATIGIDQ